MQLAATDAPTAEDEPSGKRNSPQEQARDEPRLRPVCRWTHLELVAPGHWCVDGWAERVQVVDGGRAVAGRGPGARLRFNPCSGSELLVDQPR